MNERRFGGLGCDLVMRHGGGGDCSHTPSNPIGGNRGTLRPKTAVVQVAPAAVLVPRETATCAAIQWLTFSFDMAKQVHWRTTIRMYKHSPERRRASIAPCD